MRAVLSAVRLGFDVSLDRLVTLALLYGFQGVEPSGAAFFGSSPRERAGFLDRIAAEGLGWRGSAVPGLVGTATDEREFEAIAARVAERAPILAAAGVAGFTIWIAPGNDEAPFAETMEIHRRRLGRLAEIADAHGLRVALEYVGPLPSRSGYRHPFVHDLVGIIELVDSMSHPERFAYVLDTFHWHAAGETATDLLTLRAEDILIVDANDGVVGRSRERQRDGERALPAATGVIDAASFFAALSAMGYDGPVVAEPLESGVAALDVESRVAGARAGLRRLLDGRTSA